MRFYFLITLTLLFYIFFMLRALTLSKALRKKSNSNSSLLNMSILLVSISTIIFLAFLTARAYLKTPLIGDIFLILFSSKLLKVTGSVLIALGSTSSIIASLTLKKSWPMGVDENEITKLITNGIYKISKIPYFLSCDMVLIGMVFCLLSPFLILLVLITIMLFHLSSLNDGVKYLEKQLRDNYRQY